MILIEFNYLDIFLLKKAKKHISIVFIPFQSVVAADIVISLVELVEKLSGCSWSCSSELCRVGDLYEFIINYFAKALDIKLRKINFGKDCNCE